MTRRSSPTNAEVVAGGKLIDDWACDIDPHDGEMESNAGREGVYEMPDGRRYVVITGHDGSPVLCPRASARGVHETWTGRVLFLLHAEEEPGFATREDAVRWARRQKRRVAEQDGLDGALIQADAWSAWEAGE